MASGVRMARPQLQRREEESSVANCTGAQVAAGEVAGLALATLLQQPALQHTVGSRVADATIPLQPRQQQRSCCLHLPHVDCHAACLSCVAVLGVVIAALGPAMGVAALASADAE